MVYVYVNQKAGAVWNTSTEQWWWNKKCLAIQPAVHFQKTDFMMCVFKSKKPSRSHQETPRSLNVKNRLWKQEQLNCPKDNFVQIFLFSETVMHNLWTWKQIHDTCLLLNTETSTNWKRKYITYITYPIIPPRCTRLFSLSPTSRAFKNSLRLVFYTWDWYIWYIHLHSLDFYRVCRSMCHTLLHGKWNTYGLLSRDFSSCRCKFHTWVFQGY